LVEARVVGTSVDDDLVGTDQGEQFGAKEGNDRVFARGGDDQVFAGPGNDTVYASTGNDSIYAGTGNDQVFGGPGNDIVYAGDGDDTVYVGVGTDTVYAGIGNDLIGAGADSDLLYGGAGNDTIFAAGGNDSIFGGIGNDRLYGGEGDDAFTDAAGNDTMFGGSGDDTAKFDGSIDDLEFGTTTNGGVTVTHANGEVDVLYDVEFANVGGEILLIDDILNPPPPPPEEDVVEYRFGDISRGLRANDTMPYGTGIGPENFYIVTVTNGETGRDIEFGVSVNERGAQTYRPTEFDDSGTAEYNVSSGDNNGRADRADWSTNWNLNVGGGEHIGDDVGEISLLFSITQLSTDITISGRLIEGPNGIFLITNTGQTFTLGDETSTDNPFNAGDSINLGFNGLGSAFDADPTTAAIDSYSGAGFPADEFLIEWDLIRITAGGHEVIAEFDITVHALDPEPAPAVVDDVA